MFPYFTDPGRYVQWMGAGAVLEPVPGGCYRIVMRDGVEAAGEFVEIDPPHCAATVILTRRLSSVSRGTYSRRTPSGISCTKLAV